MLALLLPRGAGAQAVPPSGPPTAPPPLITLDEAVRRAETNEPTFAAALAESRATGLNRSIARAALLPIAVYHNQYLFTQANGLHNVSGQPSFQPAPIFIANNTVHEYTSQAAVTETIGLKQIADIRVADAGAARAAAEFEITRRGLVASVVSLFYGSLAADAKVSISSRAAKEATAFTDLATKREAVREGAHADVVKAQLLEQQRSRDLADATLAADRARLELAVLLFPDPRSPFRLDPSADLAPLPSRAEIEARAGANNPELRSALATLNLGNADVLSARSALLPDLGLNFNYGIDAPQFARNGPGSTTSAGRVRNLGYSIGGTLDIPVWDWLATEHRVKQSEIRRDAARIALTATERRLIVNLEVIYAEAQGAFSQVASLNQSAQTAQESLRLTKLRYGNGEATVLEVVDAQSALVIAENAQQDGTIRLRTALANLQTLTGTL